LENSTTACPSEAERQFSEGGSYNGSPILTGGGRED